MNLSIIIPTFEEEKYLPLLLASIKKQKINGDYEIIVADAGSKDKTVKIAKSQGCKIIEGGLPGRGRNEGVKMAKGDLLLFLDADTILPESSLENFLSEFKKRNLGVAGFLLQPVGGNKFIEILYNLFYNWLVLLVEKVDPHAPGAILIRKDIHQKIRGFDEEIRLAEDHDYVKRAAKFGKFGILKSTKIFFSQRRFEKEGWLKTYFKHILAKLHLIFLGPVKSNIFKYNLRSRRFKK